MIEGFFIINSVYNFNRKVFKLIEKPASVEKTDAGL